MKSLFRFALLLLFITSGLLFSEAHAQEKVFKEKFIQNETPSSKPDLANLKSDIVRLSKKDKSLEDLSMQRIDELTDQGKIILSEREYSRISNRIHNIKSSLAFEEDKAMIKKYRNELELLKSKYVSTRTIVKASRRKK